jgi:hypothetical protein
MMPHVECAERGVNRSSEQSSITEGSPGRLIDVGEAFDALQQCAESLATIEPADASVTGDCTPLVAAALARIGLTADAMRTARLVPEPGHPRSRPPADKTSNLTLGALLVLRATERAERRGADPLVAVRHARAVLLKYVSVLPASLFAPTRAQPDPPSSTACGANHRHGLYRSTRSEA